MVWSKELGHRSVGSFKKFCGWTRLKRSLRKLDYTTKFLVLSLFKTGGRCTETLTLNREQIDIMSSFLHVIDMPVYKRHLSYIPDRTVTIYMNEDLTDEWISMFPTRGKFFDFKYDKAYKLIREIQRPEKETKGPWFPHRYRAERARQLVRDYKYDQMLLKAFFGWARDSTAENYADANIGIQEDRILQSLRS